MSDNLLNNAEASGVFHLVTSGQSTIEMAARHIRFCVLKADIVSPLSAHDVLHQLGAALNFPTWYGVNFDALHDCLTDPDWQPAKGYVLFITGMDQLRTSNPADFATLIEVFQAAAEARRAMNTPFWVLIDAAARGVPILTDV